MITKHKPSPRMRTWRDIDPRPPLYLRLRLWAFHHCPRLRAAWLILSGKEPLPYYPVRPLRRGRSPRFMAAASLGRAHK